MALCNRIQSTLNKSRAANILMRHIPTSDHTRSVKVNMRTHNYSHSAHTCQIRSHQYEQRHSQTPPKPAKNASSVRQRSLEHISIAHVQMQVIWRGDLQRRHRKSTLQFCPAKKKMAALRQRRGVLAVDHVDRLEEPKEHVHIHRVVRRSLSLLRQLGRNRARAGLSPRVCTRLLTHTELHDIPVYYTCDCFQTGTPRRITRHAHIRGHVAATTL